MGITTSVHTPLGEKKMPKLNCDDAPLKELRFAVLKKHGKIYGALKKEANLALHDRAKKILENEVTEGAGG